MRTGLAGLLLAAVMLTVTACSSTGSSTAASSHSPSAAASTAPSVSPGASTAVCQDVTAVRTSLSDLAHITPGANALGKLKTDLGNVKSSLDSLRSTAGTAWKAQIDALTSALGKLQKTLTSLGSQSSASAAAEAVSTDLAAVTIAGSNLLRTASIRCPEPSASPS